MTSVRERVLAFLHGEHPHGMPKQVAAATARATRGPGVPANTISQWEKRGNDPSAAHLWTLGVTYGLRFIACVWVEVGALETARQAEELAAAEARVVALRAAAAAEQAIMETRLAAMPAKRQRALDAMRGTR